MAELNEQAAAVSNPGARMSSPLGGERFADAGWPSHSDVPWRPAPRRPAPRFGMEGVAYTVHTEIVPKLILAHRRTELSATRNDLNDGAAHEITAFAELMAGPHYEEAPDVIESWRARGATLEAIYLKLLVPAAKYLRQLWRDDLCDFADMTLGFWRLQQLLRQYAPAFCGEHHGQSPGLRALLTPGPGEKQDLGYLMFGIVLAGEFFRRDAWDTWIEPDSSSKEFADLIRGQWFDVVEFFASGDKRLDALASSIRMARRTSPNPGLGIMVCGPAFIDHPELVLMVGGDANVTDLRQESIQAQHVVSLTARRR